MMKSLSYPLICTSVIGIIVIIVWVILCMCNVATLSRRLCYNRVRFEQLGEFYEDYEEDEGIKNGSIMMENSNVEMGKTVAIINVTN